MLLVPNLFAAIPTTFPLLRELAVIENALSTLPSSLATVSASIKALFPETCLMKTISRKLCSEPYSSGNIL